jgi:hypothetical protein
MFGGFADGFLSTGKNVASPNAFIFGLVTNKGREPFKLAQGGEKPDPASAVVDRDRGPCWGRGCADNSFDYHAWCTCEDYCGGSECECDRPEDPENIFDLQIDLLTRNGNRWCCANPGYNYNRPPDVDAAGAREYFAEGVWFKAAEVEIFRVSKTLPRGFSMETEIASPQHQHQIAQWVPEQNPRFELLYRASRDGWRSADFHRKCDNKGQTVALFKSARGFTFGGFADRPWQSSGGQHPSPQAFLFGLFTHRDGDWPTKITQGGQNPSAAEAVRDDPHRGPCWGTYDLMIDDYGYQRTSHTSRLGDKYNPPPAPTTCITHHRQPQSSDYLDGYFAEDQFTLAEFEVFRVGGDPPWL